MALCISLCCRFINKVYLLEKEILKRRKSIKLPKLWTVSNLLLQTVVSFMETSWALHSVHGFTLLVAVIEFICAFQIVPFGVLCFLPSYKALEKFTSRWQVNYFTFYSDYTHIHFAGLPCLCRLLKLCIFIDVGPFECSPCLRH